MKRFGIVIDRDALIARLTRRQGVLPGFPYPGHHWLRERVIHLLWLVIVNDKPVPEDQITAAIRPIVEIRDASKRHLVATYIYVAVFPFEPAIAAGLRDQIAPRSAPAAAPRSGPALSQLKRSLSDNIPLNQRWCPGTR